MSWIIGLVDFEGTSSVESSGKCVSTYMRKYLVRTDAPTLQTEGQVAAAVGIGRGAPLDADPSAICRSVKIGMGPAMTRPPYMAYFATYEFSTDTTLPEADDDDPTTTRTIWAISPQIQSRYIIRDKDEKLIVNKAGTPYDGGIPVDVRLGSVTAKRNKLAAGYDVNSVLANSGKLNSATYLGGEPGTVQVDISAQERYEGAFHFWEETFVFSYDPLGWQPKPANAGFYALDDDDEPYRILNKHLETDPDNPVSDDPDGKVPEPEPLDDDGRLVPMASRPDSCTFVEVEYFDEMDFESFDL